MFGKRDEKKNLLKNKILAAARDTFKSQDYESTTIGQIAEKAGVGLGTAYNYFKSKEEIFLLSMAEELIDQTGNDSKPNHSPGDPADVIVETVIKNIKRLNFFSKKIWLNAIAAFFTSIKTKNFISKELIRSDYRFMDGIRVQLEELQIMGQLPAGFSVDTAVNLIFGAVMINLMNYVCEEQVTFEDACQKIEEGIRHILRN